MQLVKVGGGAGRREGQEECRMGRGGSSRTRCEAGHSEWLRCAHLLVEVDKAVHMCMEVAVIQYVTNTRKRAVLQPSRIQQ